MNLPVISGKECAKILAQAGFHEVRQQGSHLVMRKDNPFCQLIVPLHKELDRGTLRAIIRQSGLSLEEFRELS